MPSWCRWSTKKRRSSGCPNREVGAYHDAKYAVYRRMIDDHCAYRSMMATFAASAGGSPGA